MSLNVKHWQILNMDWVRKIIDKVKKNYHKDFNKT